MCDILNEARIDEFEELAAEEAAAAPEIDIEPDPQPAGLNFDLSWLKTPTGSGSIDDYINSPLNFSGSRGVAQLLRGLTGFVGCLDLAIIDILLGILNIAKEKKTSSGNNEQYNFIG